jgi:hypothetical protein
MDRRGFLAGGAALATLGGATIPGPAWADIDDLRTAAREAWLYGLPLIELARLRADAIGAQPVPGTPGFNAFAHARDPAGPASRDLSAPETDILYSSAWINLSAGPAKVYVPPTGGRYQCVTLSDMYGNVLQAVDGALVGKEGREITLVGPPARRTVDGYTATMPQMPVLGGAIHAPGPWVWALARTQFVGAADLANAHALQDELAVRVKTRAVAPAQPAALDAAWGDYFYAVQELIDENPPPASEALFFRRIAALQVGERGGFEKARFADPDIDGIVTGVAEARTLATTARTDDAGAAWLYPKPDFDDWGMDILYRARMALAQPGAPPPARVTSLRAVGPGGSLTFPSGDFYHLDLPEPPPVEAFWNVTLYEATPDGHLFLADTPRHSLGDKTAELKRRPDGGIDIWLGHTDPGGQKSSNWLPTPPHGAFALLLRAYGPGQALTERRYHAPPVQLLGPGTPRQR